MMKLNVLTFVAYLSCAGMPNFYARFKDKSKLIEAINANVAEQFTEGLSAAAGTSFEWDDKIFGGLLPG